MRLLVALAILLALAAAQASEFVAIKYRADPVDLSGFEYVDTYRSSFVHGAWYDESNDYLVIRLGATNYHYCRLPASIWEAFKSAGSFGRFYNQMIKGRYDCRLGGVPPN